MVTMTMMGFDTEENNIGSSPLIVDTDADGMGDYCEVVSGLDPLVDDSANDPDADGISNLDECLLETNPFSVDSDNDNINDDVDPEPAFSA